MLPFIFPLIGDCEIFLRITLPVTKGLGGLFAYLAALPSS